MTIDWKDIRVDTYRTGHYFSGMILCHIPTGTVVSAEGGPNVSEYRTKQKLFKELQEKVDLCYPENLEGTT